MKIAIVSDDEKTISAHFGRAEKYVVVTVEDGEIASREVREKVGHRQFSGEEGHQRHEHHHDERGRGFGRHSAEKHRRMFANIKDCDVVLARGMGQGAYRGLEAVGLRPILTDIAEIGEAVQAVIDGSIEDHRERLH